MLYATKLSFIIDVTGKGKKERTEETRIGKNNSTHILAR